MPPNQPQPEKQRLDDWRVPHTAAPLASGRATPIAGNPAGSQLWGPSAPQGSRPGPRQMWRPATPAAPRPLAPSAAGGAAPPLAGGSGNPLAGGSAARLAGGSAAPLAGGSANPRPPGRTGSIYRGLPQPVRVAGWTALAFVVGAVLGATAPTAIMRISEVAAIQPGLLAWYSVRALGFLAYFVLAASVLYGLLLSTKILDTIAHRPVSFALHKDLAIVAMILATLHAALLVFDHSFDFTPRSIIVPFASPYSPITVGIGQLTFYAAVVVTASFYVRRHIGQRVWRVLHYVTFLAFIGATVHGIASGSDSGSGWAFWVYLVLATASVFLTTYRIVVSIAARADSSAARRAGIPPALGPLRGPLDRPGAAPGGF